VSLLAISAELIMRFLVRLIVAFTALPVHEFAHGLVADKLGDHTARYQGRLNINPFSHMDLIGTLCLVLTGFGWGKPVQINARNFKNPKFGMAISAAAGPLSNLLMAFLTLTLQKVCFYTVLFHPSLSFLTTLSDVFGIMTVVNISLAIFNLIPIPPLDGSRILNLFLPSKVYFAIMRYEQYIFIGLFLLIWTGVLDTPLYFLNNLVYAGLNTLTGFVELIVRALL